MDTYNVRKTQALWYAWGHQDAGVKLIGDAFDFAKAYADRYQAYSDERTFFMYSMGDAFQMWQEGVDLMHDVRDREAARQAT